MARVVMTAYEYLGIARYNRLVFPECPYAGKDEDYTSHEVHCAKKDNVYCSTLHDMNACPFDKEKRNYVDKF